MSFFGNVQLAPPVAVFKLSADFRADENPKKINLGVGAYRDDDGKPWVLPVVNKVEKQIALDSSLNHEYLPIKGLPEFCDAATKLALGESKCVSEGRAAGVQTLSGTGALRLAADFLFQTFPAETTVLYSNPTWGNHLDIFKRAGFKNLAPYSYWSGDIKAADVSKFVSDLEAAPDRSIILFHSCAHNPTGADPSAEQWEQLAQVVRAKNHFPIFDTAYQGFASGNPDKDAAALRSFADAGFEMMICQSFAKNFGLYNERCGNLVTITQTAQILDNVRSQQELIVRANYSNPPAHGARIVSTVLNTPELAAEWRQNIKEMSDRIDLMRNELRSRLEKLGTPGQWNHITDQIGMFSFTGLSPDQCNFLKNERSCYLMSNGRISMAGLNSKNIDYFAQCVDEAVRKIQ